MSILNDYERSLPTTVPDVTLLELTSDSKLLYNSYSIIIALIESVSDKCLHQLAKRLATEDALLLESQLETQVVFISAVCTLQQKNPDF